MDPSPAGNALFWDCPGAAPEQLWILWPGQIQPIWERQPQPEQPTDPLIPSSMIFLPQVSTSDTLRYYTLIHLSLAECCNNSRKHKNKY